jgi:hypothetical protein
MFISLLLAVRVPSLTRRPLLVVRPGALSNDGVERIGEHALWTAIQTADVVEVTRLFEVAFDEPYVTPVIQTVPDSDRLRGKTAISMLLQPTTVPSWPFG